ncbi:MAG: discoidin domain-containing protein [Clostridia bacterium]|nr:discoidin domain-containing protein [Clostridia bacterium]
MKKLTIALIVVLTLVLGLGVTVFAGLDSMYINVSTLQGGAYAGDTGGELGKSEVKINVGDKLYILGWAAKNGANLEKVVWTLNGVEKECSDVYCERRSISSVIGVSEEYLDHAGIGTNGNYMELLGVDELTDGLYEVSIIAKYDNNTREILKDTFNLIVGNYVATEQDHPVVPGKGSTAGIWLNSPGKFVAVKFTTNGSFSKISVPRTWASREDAGKAAPITLSLYNFVDNADYSMTKTPIKSYTYTTIQDGVPTAALKLDAAVPAGTYVFKLEIGKDMPEGSYLVLDEAAADADLSNVEYVNTKGKTFMFSIYGEIMEGDFLKANPANKASQELVNIDYAFLASDAVIENMGKGYDLGQIKTAVDNGAANLGLIGWYYPPKPIDSYGYQIDDGEIVYGAISCTYNADTAAVIGTFDGCVDPDWYRAFNGFIPILEGEHTVKLIAKFYDGTTKPIYESHYLNDDSDIALGKPAFVDLKGGAAYGLPFWADEFITDGTKWLFDAGLGLQPPLGWYAAGEGMTAKIYVDLEAVYDLSKIKLYPMGFADGTFPNTFNVYTSLDSENWDLVGGYSNMVLFADPTAQLTFETTNRARFICVDVTAVNGGSASIGEIEAYGTYVEESELTKPGYLPYKTYEGKANGADPGGLSSWTGFSTGALTHKFVFNTDVSFYKIGFPAFWGGAGTPVTVELVKNGETVFSTDIVLAGDGAITIDLGKTLDAGEYICKMTITNDSVNADTGNYNCYFVIGYADNGLLGKDYVGCERGQIAFDLYSNDNTGEGFIKRIYKEGMSRDQVMIEGVDKAKFGGNSAVTEIEENLYDYIGKQIQFWGWYGNNMGLNDFGVKVDGADMVVGGRYTDSSIAAHLTTNVFNGDLAFADRYSIYVDITEGEHTAEVYALTDNGEVLVWTINYKATDPEAHGLRDFDKAKGDALSYDSILKNGEIIADGNANVIATKKLVDGSDGSFTTIGMRCWFGNANSSIVSYGYRIDGGEPVYGDFAETAEQDVINAGGESRFTVTVDVTDLKDGKEHKIEVVAKLENGDIVILNRYDVESDKDREVYVNYKAPEAVTPTVKVIVGTDEFDVEPDAVSQVKLSMNENGLAVETNSDASDPWVSIPLDNIDTSVYTSFTIKYKLVGSSEFASNNVYLRAKDFNPGYSGEGGTWHAPDMNGLTERTFVIADEFPAMVGQQLTGVRFVACRPGETFIIESITFNKAEEPQPTAEVTAEINDAGKLVVTVTGTFGEKDWIGVYAEGNTPGGDAGSLVWWYVGANGGTFEVPFDGMAENDRDALLNDDGTVKEGKFVVFLLANDGYELVAGTEGVTVEVEAQPVTEPVTEPETQPQTGDAAVAMFAVIAVLAMGAAVVFMKKRAF